MEDESKLKNYIVHKNETGDVFLISFDENDKEDIIKNTIFLFLLTAKERFINLITAKSFRFLIKSFLLPLMFGIKNFAVCIAICTRNSFAAIIN